MLLFYPAAEDALSTLQREGTPEGAAFVPSLEAARRQSSGGAVLVVDAADRRAPGAPDEPVPAFPPSAFENLTPYRPPEHVAAGGGYVLRAEERSQALEARSLLLIYRRGVWDLPKGKQDPGEDVRACALREIREEAGLGEVHALGALGPTVHGYRDDTDAGLRYAVKTTHWFLMETPEADLTPEWSEGIEEAAWVPWGEVRERLGYETLRRHHRRATAHARALLGERAA
jgi:ADP-ribose pyrophosphatase YjhB (NUDIX family)